MYALGIGVLLFTGGFTTIMNMIEHTRFSRSRFEQSSLKHSAMSLLYSTVTVMCLIGIAALTYSSGKT